MLPKEEEKKFVPTPSEADCAIGLAAGMRALLSSVENSIPLTGTPLQVEAAIPVEELLLKPIQVNIALFLAFLLAVMWRQASTIMLKKMLKVQLFRPIFASLLQLNSIQG